MIITGIVALIAALGWFAWVCINAPIGYEDETGFHLGEQVFSHFDRIPASDGDR